MIVRCLLTTTAHLLLLERDRTTGGSTSGGVSFPKEESTANTRLQLSTLSLMAEDDEVNIGTASTPHQSSSFPSFPSIDVDVRMTRTCGLSSLLWKSSLLASVGWSSEETGGGKGRGNGRGNGRKETKEETKEKRMMQCRPVVGRWMLHLLRSYPVDSASGGVQWTLSLRSAMDLAVKVMSNIDMTTTAMTILHGTQWIRTTGVVQQRSKRFHEEERYVCCLLLFVVVCCCLLLFVVVCCCLLFPNFLPALFFSFPLLSSLSPLTPCSISVSWVW